MFEVTAFILQQLGWLSIILISQQRFVDGSWNHIEWNGFEACGTQPRPERKFLTRAALFSRWQSLKGTAQNRVVTLLRWAEDYGTSTHGIRKTLRESKSFQDLSIWDWDVECTKKTGYRSSVNKIHLFGIVDISWMEQSISSEGFLVSGVRFSQSTWWEPGQWRLGCRWTSPENAGLFLEPGETA